MSEKVTTQDARGNMAKMEGWFSWRHRTPDAHFGANVGRSRAETKARKRAEAEARNAYAPASHNNTRGHRLGRCSCPAEVSA